MLTKLKAAAEIEKKLAEANKLVEECEAIAKESKVDFYITTPCGSSESFDGTGEDFGDEDGNPTGWDHSQC